METRQEFLTRLAAIEGRLGALTPGQWQNDRWGGITADDGTRVCCGALLGECDGDFLRQTKDDISWLLRALRHSIDYGGFNRLLESLRPILDDDD